MAAGSQVVFGDRMGFLLPRGCTVGVYTPGLEHGRWRDHQGIHTLRPVFFIFGRLVFFLSSVW